MPGGRVPAPLVPWSPVQDAPQLAVAPHRPRNRPVFYVRKVIGRRKVAGHIEFKVRWQGFGPGADTWEPRSGLPTDLETQEQDRNLQFRITQ